MEAAAYVPLTQNVCRFIADLPEYIWYSERDTLILSQYISSSLSLDGLEASLVSDFPKSGRIKLKINSYDKKIFLKLRKPEWCDEKFDNEENGFIVYDRIFNGEEMVLDFKMKVKKNYANPSVSADLKKIAFSYGCDVLCAEGVDNGELSGVVVDKNARVKIEKDKTFGVTATVKAKRLIKTNTLYSFDPPREENFELKLIPYRYWANRQISDMKVRFNY